MKMLEKITQAMKSKGLKQSDLEAGAGLADNRISKWANGSGEPSARQALRLAKFLDLPLDYLIDDQIQDPSQSATHVPLLSYEEQVAVDLIREHKLDARTIIRRLTSKPFAYPPEQ